MINRRTALVTGAVGSLIGGNALAQGREKPIVVNAHHTN
jgi:hypothetical protein